MPKTLNELACLRQSQAMGGKYAEARSGETVRLRRKTPMAHVCDGPLRIGTIDECGLKTMLDDCIAFVESIPLDKLDSYNYGLFEEYLEKVSFGESLCLPIREAREITAGLSDKYGFWEFWDHVDDLTEQNQVRAMISVCCDESWRLSHESGGRIWKAVLEDGFLLQMLKRLRTLQKKQGYMLP
jgi:hypothetical protein